MPSFDFQPLTRVLFGEGTLLRVGEMARLLGGDRILVVSDPGIAKAGHVERTVKALEAEKLRPFVFTDVEENPTTRHVQKCLEFAQANEIDLIVGVGGGSSMDTAKGTNFLLTNGGRMQDYWGVGKATKPMLPMIAIPTTSGTGSEAQSFALIADEETHQKMACGDKKAACRVAILDPQVTVSQPNFVTAVSGIDAISHALESFVTNRRNAISKMFARGAWELLSSAFPAVLRDGNDLEMRGRMLLGANMAGAAIENSMLGATHSCANPLTARFGLTHGLAIGVMLPPVIRFNAKVCSKDYAELLRHSESVHSESEPPVPTEQAGEMLAQRVSQFVEQAGFGLSLRDYSVQESDIEKLAEEASKQWTAQFNPRPVGVEDFVAIYRAALHNETPVGK